MSIIEQLTKEEAIKFAEEKKWEGMSAIELASFQITQECLCMPFDVFHKAVEDSLGYPVFTHSFGDRGAVERMTEELSKKREETV